MSESILFSLLFAGVGVVFIGISIPLIQERVPPEWSGYCLFIRCRITPHSRFCAMTRDRVF